MLELGEVIELEICLDSTTAVEGLESLIYEGAKTSEKSVDELILIGEIGLLMVYVQYLGGGDLIVAYVEDQIGVCSQMLYRFLGDMTGELNGENLVHVLDRNHRTTDDGVKGGNYRLDALDPLDIYGSRDLFSL